MEISEFELFVTRKRSGMLAVARKILYSEDDAEDAVQDALLKLWSIRSKIELYRSVDALVTVILKNVCISMLRQRHSHTQTLIENVEMQTCRTPHDELEEREGDKWLEKEFDGLPSSQMVILKMSQVEGMSNKDIAVVLGIKEVSVRTSISKARHKLIEKLKKIERYGI